MNKDLLLKHHFWGLAALAPVLTLAAVFLVWSDISDVVAKTKKDYDGKLTEAKGVSPKGKGILGVLDKQKQTVLDQREKLWDDNWKRQSGQLPDSRVNLFEWPVDTDPRRRLTALRDKYPKFGDAIVDPEAALTVFKRPDVYEAAYDKAAAAVLPAVFPGRDWRTVLRYVVWTDRPPTSPQVWLALEDLWVQRALLLPIKEVNAAGSRMELVADPDPGAPAPPPLKRVFQNKVWRIELEVPTEGPDKLRVLRGKLTNRTDRLQVLGSPFLRLNVWLSDFASAQPVPFRVEGDFVKANETVDIKYVPALHAIPLGTDVRAISRVEQVLDERTAPVRMVRGMALGGQWTGPGPVDDRHAKTVTPAALKEPTFAGDAAPPPPPAASAAKGPAAPGAPAPGAPPGGPGAPGTPGADASAGLKGGSPAVVLDGNRKRYLDVSPQVRRMPVAVAVVVDQLFMEDVLVAYANSPLRFQTCQTFWTRFRGTLPPPAGPAAGAAGFHGSAPGAPAGRASDDGKGNAGLVELTIYGVITLYERYDPKPAPADPAAAPADATPPAPPGSLPAPVSGAPPGPPPALPAPPQGTPPGLPPSPAGPSPAPPAVRKK